jgi:hypothetical protein
MNDRQPDLAGFNGVLFRPDNEERLVLKGVIAFWLVNPGTNDSEKPA